MSDVLTRIRCDEKRIYLDNEARDLGTFYLRSMGQEWILKDCAKRGHQLSADVQQTLKTAF